MLATQRRTCISIADLFLFAVLVPISAQAAAEQVAHAEFFPASILTTIYVVGFSLLGWIAAALPSLARWVEGDLKTRLIVVQGIGASLLAGALAFLGVRVVGQSDLAGFIAAGTAAFAGKQWILNRAGMKGDPE